MIVKNPETTENVVDQIHLYLKNKSKSKHIEKGIYNFAVKKARDKNVVENGITNISFKYMLTGLEAFIITQTQRYQVLIKIYTSK